MKQFPQDTGTGLSGQDNADFADAAHLGALAHTGIEGIIDGCSLTADYTTPNVTVAEGIVRIADSLSERDHDGNQTTLTYSEAIQVYHVENTTVGLSDGQLNEVFVVGDQSNPDNATVTTTTGGTTPSGPSLKIGEIDTSNNTTSNQWHLIADSGQLTFPTESAADTAATNLREGAQIYARDTDAYLKVI